MKIKRFALMLMALLCLPLPVYAKEETSSAKIYISSEAENLDETFTYVLDDDSGKEIDRITIKSGKESYFTVIAVQPGTESYTVHQIPGTDKNATYDDTVYCVDVYTVIENDTMRSEPVIYAKGTKDKSDKCRFINKKPAPVKNPDVKTPGTETIKKPVWQSITEVVKTGDEANLQLWLCLAMVSAVGIFLLLVFSRKAEKEDIK